MAAKAGLWAPILSLFGPNSRNIRPNHLLIQRLSRAQHRSNEVVLEKLSKKPRTRQWRSPTEHREGTFRPIAPSLYWPYTGQSMLRALLKFICRHGTHWEGRDDHPKRAGTGGSEARRRQADVRPLRVAASFRRGRVDSVCRPRRDAATGVAVLRPALARRGGRAPLHAFGGGDRDRGGRRPPAWSRRRGLLAGGHGERPPGRESFGRALLLPYLRLRGGARRRSLPRAGRDSVRLRRRVMAAATHRRDPDQRRKGTLIEGRTNTGPSAHVARGSKANQVL